MHLFYFYYISLTTITFSIFLKTTKPTFNPPFKYYENPHLSACIFLTFTTHKNLVLDKSNFPRLNEYPSSCNTSYTVLINKNFHLKHSPTIQQNTKISTEILPKWDAKHWRNSINRTIFTELRLSRLLFHGFSSTKWLTTSWCNFLEQNICS